LDETLEEHRKRLLTFIRRKFSLFDSVDERLKGSPFCAGAVVDLNSDLYNLNEEDRPVIVYLDDVAFGNENMNEITTGDISGEEIDGFDSNVAIEACSSSATAASIFMSGTLATDLVSAGGLRSLSRWEEIDAKLSNVTFGRSYRSLAKKKTSEISDQMQLAEVGADEKEGSGSGLISAEAEIAANSVHMTQSEIEEGSAIVTID